MLKNKLGCRLPRFSDSRFDFGKIDPNADPALRKKINDHQKLWMKLSKLSPTHPLYQKSVTGKQLFFERLTKIGDMVEARNFDPRFFRKVERRVAKNIGDFVRELAGLDPTSAKYKRFMERRGEGYVAEELAKLEAAKRIDYAYNSMDGVFKKYKINRNDQGLLMYKSVEVGSEPWLLDYTIQANPQAVRYLEHKKDMFIQYMDNLGISKTDQAEIIRAGSDVAQVYHEVISVAEKIGVDIDALSGIGYINRVFTDEGRFLYEVAKNKGDLPKESFSGGDVVTGSFGRSREFQDWVPSDNEVLDYLFTRGKVYDRLNEKLAKDPALAVALGKQQVSKFDDLLISGGEPALLEAVINTLDEDEFRWLVQNGFISRIPWETSRVYQYMMTNYKFPFDGIQDLYVTDPRKAFQVYKKTLTEVASERSSVWGLINGAANKFGVLKSQLKPDEHAGFVPLKDVFTPRVYDEVIGKSPSSMDFLEDIYIHPDVASIFRADYELATNPLWLGVASDILNATRKWANGLVLGSSQWFGRQLIGNAGHLLALGVSPMGYFIDSARYIKASVSRMLKKQSGFDFFEVLPNKVKRFGGGQYTEAELWREAMRKGLVGDFHAFGRASVSRSNRGIISMTKRTKAEIDWLFKNYPDHFVGLAAKYGSEAMLNSADAALLFRFISWGNVMTDNIMRFNLLKGVMSDDRLLHRVGLSDWLANVPNVKNLDEAVKWVENHSFMFDEDALGRLPKPVKNTANTVLPFLNWRIKNVQQTIRFMIERPTTFGTYLELGMELYDEFKHEKPVEWQAMTTGWIDEKDFPVPFVIPADKSASGRDEFFLFPMTTVLSTPLGGVNEVTELMDLFGLFGHGDTDFNNPHNPYAKRQKTILSMIEEEASPLLKFTLELATGEDAFGNRLADLDKKSKNSRTLLGLPLDASTYHYVTSIMPMLKQLERTGAALGIPMGQAAYTDPLTGRYFPAQPSWAGVKPESKTTQNREVSTLPPLQNLLDILGMSPTYIDIYYQQGYTMSEMETQLRDAKDRLNSYRWKLAKETDPEKQEALMDEYRGLLVWAYKIEYEWALFNAWRQKLNMPSPKAMNYIVEQNLQIPEQLPEQERQGIAKQIYDRYNTRFMR